MAETMKRIIRDGNKDFANAVQKTRIQRKPVQSIQQPRQEIVKPIEYKSFFM